MTPKHIVSVEWIDSFGCSSEWQPLHRLEENFAMTCHSVGYVLSETETYLVLVPHWHPSNDSIGAQASCCGDMAIPKCAIVKRVELQGAVSSPGA